MNPAIQICRFVISLLACAVRHAVSAWSGTRYSCQVILRSNPNPKFAWRLFTKTRRLNLRARRWVGGIFGNGFANTTRRQTSNTTTQKPAQKNIAHKIFFKKLAEKTVQLFIPKKSCTNVNRIFETHQLKVRSITSAVPRSTLAILNDIFSLIQIVGRTYNTHQPAPPPGRFSTVDSAYRHEVTKNTNAPGRVTTPDTEFNMELFPRFDFFPFDFLL
ncbi:MAG: hypothetical protein JWQ27_395 [Ferruginibacter sp.]|nr:hypothetical protein [Ferruginibacter sp.]